MVSAKAWAEVPQIAKQAVVGSSLKIIEEYAQASAAAGGFDRAEAHLSRTRVTLDAEGWEQLLGATLEYVEKIEGIERAALARMDKRPHEEQPTEATVVVMSFEGARHTDAKTASSRVTAQQLR